MKRLTFALLLALGLCGCKPPKFDQSIDCPNYHETGVSVYIWESGTFVVAFPPVPFNGKKVHGRIDVVSNVECVVNYR